jgi:hypothetical protein
MNTILSKADKIIVNKSKINVESDVYLIILCEYSVTFADLFSNDVVQRGVQLSIQFFLMKVNDKCAISSAK